MNSKLLAKIVAVLITVILLALLFAQINLGNVITTLQNINPIFLIAGFLLYTCSYFFRAWRFHILLNKEVGINDLFHIVCIHNLMNSLLPARTGELSYVYLLKKINHRTTGEGIASLIAARVFDFIVVVTFFLIAVLVTQNLPSIIISMIWLIFLFLLILIASLFFLYHSKHPMTLLKNLLHIVHLDQRKIGIFLLNKGLETIDSLEKIRSRWKYAYIFLISVPIWFSNYLLAFLLMESMNLHLPLQVVILGSTFSLISTLLPINGIAGFGTQESIWVLIFVPLGLTLNDAIISGFIVHIVVIIYYVILGAFSMFWLQYTKNSRNTD